jgi:hypothetical protein
VLLWVRLCSRSRVKAFWLVHVKLLERLIFGFLVSEYWGKVPYHGMHPALSYLLSKPVYRSQNQLRCQEVSAVFVEHGTAGMSAMYQSSVITIRSTDIRLREVGETAVYFNAVNLKAMYSRAKARKEQDVSEVQPHTER